MQSIADWLLAWTVGPHPSQAPLMQKSSFPLDLADASVLPARDKSSDSAQCAPRANQSMSLIILAACMQATNHYSLHALNLAGQDQAPGYESGSVGTTNQ